MQTNGRVRTHLRTNVVGYVAIFLFAIAGTAYGTHPGGDNTIDSGDIINGQVSTGDISNENGVRSADVRDDTLTDGGLAAVDLAANSVRTAEISNSNGVRSADVRDDTQTDGGLAAVDLAANSVGSSEIQTDAVQATEIADNSIDAGEIVDGSLTASDLAVDAVRASELGTITTRSATSANIPPNGNGSITATCLAGEQIISGGNDGFFDVFVVASRQSGNGWAVFAHNNSAGNRTVTAHAYCLSP